MFDLRFMFSVLEVTVFEIYSSHVTLFMFVGGGS